MSLVQTIKQLCQEQNLTFAQLERILGLSNGSIRRWDNNAPSADRLQRVADYFHVSVDYLLGRRAFRDGFAVVAPNRADYDIGPLTEQEKNELTEYLQFLRSRKQT